MVITLFVHFMGNFEKHFIYFLWLHGACTIDKAVDVSFALLELQVKLSLFYYERSEASRLVNGLPCIPHALLLFSTTKFGTQARFGLLA